MRVSFAQVTCRPVIVDPDFLLTPGLVLAMWAGGMAAAIAAVAFWRIVGPGFFWVAGASTLLIGGWTVFGGGLGAWVGVGGIVAAMVFARNPRLLGAAMTLAALGFIVDAAAQGGWPLAVTGAVALGGVTAEMLLGHWYLVNPKMPRWALRRLDVAGASALVLDAALLVAASALVGGGVVGWAFLGLSFMSVLLMVAVWFSLKEPSYPGVMAATGLSYLAVLTALGATVAGRSLVGQAVNLLAASNLAP